MNLYRAAVTIVGGGQFSGYNSRPDERAYIELYASPETRLTVLEALITSRYPHFNVTYENKDIVLLVENI